MKIEAIFLISSLLLVTAMLVATVIWFLKKEYKSIRWFPILKILESKEFIIMKLSKDIPRIIPFICFIVISSIMLFLSLSPYKEKNIEEKKSKNVYIVLDLSASVESCIDIEEYKKVIKRTLVSSLDKTDKVFLYTSLGENYNVSSENIDSILDNIQSFQRSGIKLGNMIRNLPIEDGVVLILSDNDAFSWSDFDIESFSKKMIVKQVFLSNKNTFKDNNNFFIKDIVLVDKNNIYFSFRVNIETSFPLKEEKKGNIEVLYDNEVVNSMDWSFSKDKTSISLDIDIDTESIKSSSNPLYFKLNLKDSDDKFNLIKSDDSYRVYPDSYYSAFIVSATFGERLLDDYFFFLQKSLDSLGVHSKRMDSLKNIDTSKYSLLILEGSENILDFCPNKSHISKNQFIWIQPSIKSFFSVDSDLIYKNICRCISYLTDDNYPDINREPRYCSNIGSMGALSEYLKYSGAIQVGGNTGEDGSIAWMIKKNMGNDNDISNDSFNFKLLSWLVPISPIRQIGIDHGTFAMMVSSILEANGFFNKDSLFPRISDLSNNSWFYKKNLDYLESNVPYSESLLKTVNIDNSFIVRMDELYNYNNDNLENTESVNSDDISNYSNLDFKSITSIKESYPIVIGSIFVVIIFMLVEVLYLFYIRLIKKRKDSYDK